MYSEWRRGHGSSWFLVLVGEVGERGRLNPGGRHFTGAPDRCQVLFCDKASVTRATRGRGLLMCMWSCLGWMRRAARSWPAGGGRERVTHSSAAGVSMEAEISLAT